MPGFCVSEFDKNRLIEVNSGYFCKICDLVLRDPVQTECGHMFCRSCLCFENSPKLTCCLDGDAIYESKIFQDNFMRREVLDLRVSCTSEGCTWQGELRDLEIHIAARCEFLKVQCVHDACGLWIRRCDFSHHLDKECVCRLEKCRACNKKFSHNMMKEHCRKAHNNLHIEMDNLRDVVDNMYKEIRRLQEEIQELQMRIDAFRPDPSSSSFQRPRRDMNISSGCPRFYSLSKPTFYPLAYFTGMGRVYENSLLQHNTTQESSRRHDRRIDSTEHPLPLRNVTLADLEENVRQHEFSSYDGQLLWKISDYARRRNDAVTGQQVSFYSPCFYTSRYGYKMCSRIHLNGDGMGSGTHISIFFVVMRGQYDALLRWPFRQKVTFMLLDQDNVEHVINAFRPDPSSSSFQRPKKDMNIASGVPMFCSLAELNNHAYVRDDTMFLRIIVDTSDIIEDDGDDDLFS